MGIQINGTTDTISAADGSLSVPSINNGINISGVSTLGNTVIGGATTEVVVTGSVDVSSTVTSVFGNFTALTASSNSGFHVDGGAPASSFLLGNTGDLSLGNDFTVAGNAGIGTNNPTGNGSETTTHIHATNYPVLHLTNSTTGTSASDGSELTLNNDGSLILRNRENSFIRFDTNGSEKVRITSAGNVGIGTDTPVFSASYGNLSLVGGSGGQVEFKGTTANKASYIYGAEDLNLYTGAGGDIVFYTGGANERARFKSNGNLAFPSGAGIDFSANTTTGTGTSTSSVLDDYERGTWTPSFVQAGTTNNMYINNGLTIYHADYVKIGNNVWISCYIQNDASFNYDTGRSGSDGLGITGLPFTVSNTPADSGYYAVNVGYFSNWTSWSGGYTPMGYFYSGQSSLALIYAVANGTSSVLAQYLYSPNSAIILSGFYQTD